MGLRRHIGACQSTKRGALNNSSKKEEKALTIRFLLLNTA